MDPLLERKLSKVSRLHAAVQVIVAQRLSEQGFVVSLEHEIDRVHVADVLAYNDTKSLIVEVETGYLPPMFISCAEDYIEAKLALKALKYSCSVDEFYIAMPSYMRLPIPRALTGQLRNRDELERLSHKVAAFFGNKWAQAIIEEGYRCKISGIMLVNLANKTIKVAPL